jgi:hypothetical protein
MRHPDDQPAADVGSFRSDGAVTSRDVARMSDAELLSLYQGLFAQFDVILMQGDSLPSTACKSLINAGHMCWVAVRTCLYSRIPASAGRAERRSLCLIIIVRHPMVQTNLVTHGQPTRMGM